MSHKSSGLAVARIGGKDVYFGPWGTPAAEAAYRRAVRAWFAGQDAAVAAKNSPPPDAAPSVNYLLLEYLRSIEGLPGSATAKVAVREFSAMFGRRAAREVGPLAIDEFRLSLVRRKSLPRKTGGAVRPLSSTYIRKLLATIRKAFRWAAGREIVPASTYEALRLAPCLRFGEARETEPIDPVDDAVVDATIQCLPRVVADMVRAQQLLGCRPGELVQLRPGDIDRRGEIWRWRLRRHKTSYRGRQRVVPIGPRAQAILTHYLSRPAHSHCFSPAESEAQRRKEQRAARKTRVQPSQASRVKRRKRKHAEAYTVGGYRQAVARAAVRAGVEPWSPNRLRHSRGTEVRALHGIEAAGALLGHSKLSATEVYARRDESLAERAAAETG